MRRVITLLVLLAAMWAPAAFAQCVGKNLVPELRQSDPAGIDQVFAKARSVPNAEGRYWKITRDGVEPSYLFGTFHSPQAIETVPDDVWAQFDKARIAIFELSQEEQASLKVKMGSDITFIMDPDLPPLLSVISDEQRQVLEQAFATRGLPVEASNQMRPWMLASLLGFPACHLRTMAEGATVLDTHMAERAIANGIAETGLESFDAALKAFSSLTRDQLLAALVSTDKWLGMEEDVFRTHSELYASGDIQAISELGLWLAERENPPFDVRALNDSLMEGLLDTRNRAWMPKVSAELALGNAFIAVGALHLPGSAGLVELIRAEGYQIERLDKSQ